MNVRRLAVALLAVSALSLAAACSAAESAEGGGSNSVAPTQGADTADPGLVSSTEGSPSDGKTSSAGDGADTTVDDALAQCPDGVTTGITDDEIIIGGTYPLTGPVGSVGLAESGGKLAYFAKVNAEGGVTLADGKTRQIKYIVYDDGYDAARARANIVRLVEQDGVFAVFGPFGTHGPLAAREYVSENCVPMVYPGSGDIEFGNPDYPWVVAPTLLSYSADARAAATFILDKVASGTVAVLRQNDALGESMFYEFQRALDGTDVTVADVQLFDPSSASVSSQMTTLGATEADAFVMLTARGAFQLQALKQIGQSSWSPSVKYLTNLTPDVIGQLEPDAVHNVYYGTITHNIMDPKFIAESDMAKEFYTWWDKSDHAADLPMQSASTGWTYASMLVKNLESMPEISRKDLIKQVGHFTLEGQSIFLDSVQYSIDWPDDPYGMVDEVIMGATMDAGGTLSLEPVMEVKQQGLIHYHAPSSGG